MTRPSPSGKPKVTPTHPDCAAAFQKIAFDCVARVKASHGGALAGNPEAVHQMRVALTRLRAAVSFFAPMTADAKWRYLKKEIAWLNASLGAARDSDVLVAYARRKRFRAWAQRRTDQGLDKCQARDHRRLVRCLDSQQFQSLMEAMASRLEAEFARQARQATEGLQRARAQSPASAADTQKPAPRIP
jgi:CHAD domain-containing protein